MKDIKTRVYGTFLPARILLPPRGADMTRWSVIACDQFTSEPEYWRELADFVGDAPSSLECILPEAFLADATPSAVMKITTAMRNYLYNYLEEVPYGMLYVERTLSCGAVRRGIVCAVDLEEYDFRESTDVIVRATEATVAERIPPRVRIRSGACIELPHSMLLVNDGDGSVIASAEHAGEPLYGFELMQGAGSVRAYGITPDGVEAVRRALAELARDESFFVAVGDGNHSLATAKTWWEHLKPNVPKEEREHHPARFALTEIVGIYDESLDFEPIYRLVSGCDPTDLISALRRFAASAEHPCAKTQTLEYVTARERGIITFDSAPHSLTVGSLEAFLGEYYTAHPEITVDYIHGKDTLCRLASAEGAAGFLFDGIGKAELFSAVEEHGVLPKKAFSMGEARDKRHYIEARRIKSDGELVI